MLKETQQEELYLKKERKNKNKKSITRRISLKEKIVKCFKNANINPVNNQQENNQR